MLLAEHERGAHPTSSAIKIGPGVADNRLRGSRMDARPPPGSRQPREATLAHILIIDDNEKVRVLLREALQRAGHEIREAGDGVTGMRLFATHKFDLVITDIVMPEQEGIESIRKIRALDKTTPIFAISGSGSGASTYLETAKFLGATRTFEKPFRIPEILAAVEEVTRRRPAA